MGQAKISSGLLVAFPHPPTEMSWSSGSCAILAPSGTKKPMKTAYNIDRTHKYIYRARSSWV